MLTSLSPNSRQFLQQLASQRLHGLICQRNQLLHLFFVLAGKGLFDSVLHLALPNKKGVDFV
jgi:hypothetical protein